MLRGNAANEQVFVLLLLKEQFVPLHTCELYLGPLQISTHTCGHSIHVRGSCPLSPSTQKNPMQRARSTHLQEMGETPVCLKTSRFMGRLKGKMTSLYQGKHEKMSKERHELKLRSKSEYQQTCEACDATEASRASPPMIRQRRHRGL